MEYQLYVESHKFQCYQWCDSEQQQDQCQEWQDQMYYEKKLELACNCKSNTWGYGCLQIYNNLLENQNLKLKKENNFWNSIRFQPKSDINYILRFQNLEKGSYISIVFSDSQSYFQHPNFLYNNIQTQLQNEDHFIYGSDLEQYIESMVRRKKKYLIITQHTINKFMPEISYKVLIKNIPIFKEAIQECSICLCQFEQDDKIRITVCFHIFHKECLDQWIKKHGTCPTCRHKINRKVLEDKENLTKEFQKNVFCKKIIDCIRQQEYEIDLTQNNKEFMENPGRYYNIKNDVLKNWKKIKVEKDQINIIQQMEQITQSFNPLKFMAQFDFFFNFPEFLEKSTKQNESIYEQQHRDLSNINENENSIQKLNNKQTQINDENNGENSYFNNSCDYINNSQQQTLFENSFKKQIIHQNSTLIPNSNSQVCQKKSQFQQKRYSNNFEEVNLDDEHKQNENNTDNRFYFN
ncbi:hypothetical protein PPERSA_07308 [Pseudocohnilembus persalinus]|uniref:RING-type domain-containing protein n=1 Tax=Pseudocohnilembus persalinus TaxID=266149 RepID=A0A0V0R6U8_PSEPJ|nr:hypothetical protein PPERSA_07308 [Pseudocohnilembus persalinus]|eukprot:KRX10223.1 hypothetical protein PPERSA_07308 [Pseudocohnilembus persalinus]